MSRGLFARIACVLACVVVLLLPKIARAHTIGLSNGEYRIEGDDVVVTLAFARGEVSALVADLDRDRDGVVTEDELTSAKGAIEERVLPLVRITTAGEACTPKLESQKLTELDGLTLTARYACKPGVPKPVTLKLFSALPKGHRHLFRELVEGEPPRDDILFGGHESASLVGKAARAEAPPPSSFVAFFRLGIEHILTGYDHLVFLLGLVLVRGKARDYVTVITAFTLAHSITLGMAVLGVVNPPSRFVEPAIALSIAYVGIENFLVKDASRRWRITFPFGLLHGFGFAGALRELDLPRARVPGALVAFNVGVEAGQLAVLVVALPLVLFVTKKHTRVPVTRALSAAVTVAGVVWFVARVVA